MSRASAPAGVLHEALTALEHPDAVRFAHRGLASARVK